MHLTPEARLRRSPAVKRKLRRATQAHVHAHHAFLTPTYTDTSPYTETELMVIETARKNGITVAELLAEWVRLRTTSN